MIRPNKKIGIVYSFNSIKYANELKQIIINYRTEGYCIEPIMVDNFLLDQERNIELRVFDNLSKCDYAFVFLTKDLYINSKDMFVSKPNVILELGYLKGQLNKNSIWIISDFPYKDINDNKYMMPSDIPAEYLEEIDANNSNNDLKTLFNKFLNIMKNNIVKMNEFNINDLTNSLVLNSAYKTNYENLFPKVQFESIEKYSLEWQLKEIFSIWMSEKSMLSDAEQIVYIFERIVFLPFFPEKIIGSQLIDFLSVDVTEENSYIMACCKIIKNVNLYEEHKRKRNQIESTIFYTNIAKAILEEMQKFKLSKIAPIIGCVSKNYIGLSYLNSSLKSCNKENLKVAEKNFKEVIELSSNNLGDNMDVIQAFAKYNLARVKKNLNENAEAEYSIAIHKRDELSKASKFPQMFRLNFALERIHAEIDFCDYMLKTQEIDTTCYLRKIETMQKELSDIRQTPAADVSLFATIEDKLKQCAEEI